MTYDADRQVERESVWTDPACVCGHAKWAHFADRCMYGEDFLQVLQQVPHCPCKEYRPVQLVQLPEKGSA